MASRGRESAASGHLHSFLFFFSFHPFTLSSVLAWFQGAGSVSFRRSWVIMLHLLSSLLFLLGRISAKRRRMHFLKATPALLCAPYNLYLSASLDLSLSLSSLFFFLPLLRSSLYFPVPCFPLVLVLIFFFISLFLSAWGRTSLPGHLDPAAHAWLRERLPPSHECSHSVDKVFPLTCLQ